MPEVGVTIAELDEKGRLTIPKEIREQTGFRRKVLLIRAGDHIKVIPLPADPFAVLKGALNTKKTFFELRKQAEQLAQTEAGR